LTLGNAVQSWLQAPQLVGSDFRSTHLVVHKSGEGDAQLDEQVKVVPFIEQSAVGATQVFPHAPQLDCVLRSVSQPSSGRVEQCPKPEAQAAAGTTQAPELHVTPVAPGLTFGSVVQSWPQVPQFFGSDFKSTQVETQTSGVGAAQLAEHCGPVAVDAHKDTVDAHFMPQLPQVCESSKLVSQPSSALDEQWPYPDVQAEAGT